MPTDELTHLAQIARELYAVVPAEFITARNARAARRRQDGQRELAAAVKKLPKAAAAAWAVSAVVREAPDDVDALGALGAELRVAQRLANPAELRSLSRRRRELVAALTRTAVRIAAEQDAELSPTAREQVGDTWQAVVIDPVAERAVRSGLLVRPLQPGDSDTRAALALPDAVEGLDRDADDADDGRVVRLVRSAERQQTSSRTNDAEDRTAEVDQEAQDRAEDRTAEVDQEAQDDEEDLTEGDRGTRDEDEDVAGTDEPEEGHVRGGIRIRRARPGQTREGGGVRARDRSRAGGRRGGAAGVRSAGPAASTPSDDTAASRDAGADSARELRRLRRELRSRERVATAIHEELEEATEELARVEAEVLQAAARLEELRREVLKEEQRLEELDEARAAATEEREDAEERAQGADTGLAEVRARLTELDPE